MKRADKILGISMVLFLGGGLAECFALTPLASVASLLGVFFFFWWFLGDHYE
jgi:hypothetical protein